MTDGEVLHLFGQAGGEVVVDRFLHKETTGTGAALPVEAVNHENSGVERPLEVGIVKHDDRVFTAKLKVNPLQCGRALSLNHRSGGRLADKGDGLDLRVFGQRLARALPPPMNGVEHPWWKASLHRNLRK